MITSRLAVVVPPELAAGYRLAGAVVVPAASPAEATHAIGRIIAEGERGVVAIYEPYFLAQDQGLQQHLGSSLAPVFVTIPAGLGAEPRAARRTRLAALLQRAVGYRITFRSDE